MGWTAGRYDLDSTLLGGEPARRFAQDVFEFRRKRTTPQGESPAQLD